MAIEFSQWNQGRYERDQQELQKILDDAGANLGEKICLLVEQQLNCGFIKDDLRGVRRCRLVCEQNRSIAFLAQYNPKRAERHAGAGRKNPPTGAQVVNGGCFLCRSNIYWQQCGLEMGYRFEVNGRQYWVWCNPFPLMPVHITIATDIHEPQSWLEDQPTDGDQPRAQRIIDDLLEIVAQTPQFIGFYNGLGAGATIPSHLHFHFFKRPEGQEPYPLEKAALKQKKAESKPPFKVEPYPITCVYFHGHKTKIIEQAVHFFNEWTEVCGSSINLSANVIATLDKADPSPNYHLYIVPRNMHFSISPGRTETVGGFEVLGEIAFCYDSEKIRLDSGGIDYDTVSRILMAVEAPESHTLITKLQTTLSL